MNAPPALAVHRLCSRAAAREPVIARLALTALVSEVADSLASLPLLPPQSVLLLRRMSLALPGFSLERLPDSGVRAETGRIARSELADACAKAQRPAHETVSELALAVLFADAAELLACLARDALAGNLDRWWWRTLLGKHYPDWQTAWREEPEAVPGALRLLARAGLETAVLTALGGTGQARETRAGSQVQRPATPCVTADETPHATAAHIDDRLQLQITPAPDAGRVAAVHPSASAFVPSSPPLSVRTSRQEPIPPSAPAVATPATPAVAIACPPGAVSLARPAGAALVDSGTRAASAARADGRRAIAAIDSRSVTPADTEGGDTSLPQGGARYPATYANTGTAPMPVPGTNAARAEPPLRRAVRFVDEETRPDKPPTASSAAAALPAPPPVAAQHGEHPPPTPATPALSRHTSQERPDNVTAAPKNAPAPLAAMPRAIISRHARLLFLVNVLLGDGLYPDFTRPADPGFPLSIWRLLGLLGDSLLGPSFRSDPLRTLLDRLGADTPDKYPSSNALAFARDWPVPSVPLAAAANRRWHLRRARQEGFARWFAHYRRSLRWRLARALAVPPALVGRALVQNDGHAVLWVSEANIVVVHRLDGHPVAWRLAGLDRDPGYLPSAGRSLRFVFE